MRSAQQLTMPAAPSPQEQAYEESQKYKEGKFILEREKIVEIEGKLGPDCFAMRSYHDSDDEP